MINTFFVLFGCLFGCLFAAGSLHWILALLSLGSVAVFDHSIASAMLAVGAFVFPLYDITE